MEAPNLRTPYHSMNRILIFFLAIALSCAMALPALAQNPVPTINAAPPPAGATAGLVPSSAGTGSPSFVLTVNGAHFVAGSTVQWNGTNRATSFVSATQLTASILLADIAVAGTANITVFSPAPGGGTSNAVVFTISDCGGNTHYSGGIITQPSAIFMGIAGRIKTVRNALCGPTGTTDQWIGVSGKNGWVQTGSTDLGTAYTDAKVPPRFQSYVEWNANGKVGYIFTQYIPGDSCPYVLECQQSTNHWKATISGKGYPVTDILDCAFENAKWFTEPHHDNDHTSGTKSNHSMTSNCQYELKANSSHAQLWFPCSTTGTLGWGHPAVTYNSATSLSPSTNSVDVWDPRDP